jgi:transcriptional regulator with XRE-family HTH domain
MGFKEIGRKIQKARDEKGLTQVDLAQELGITQAALSNYELGKRRLYLHQIEQIARTLGKNLDYFIADEHSAPVTDSPEPTESTFDAITARIARLDAAQLRSLNEFLDFIDWRKQHAHPD